MHHFNFLLVMHPSSYDKLHIIQSRIILVQTLHGFSSRISLAKHECHIFDLNGSYMYTRKINS